MTSIVLVEDRKLTPISNFIADLCEISDIDRRKISIRSIKDGEGLEGSHIMLLNGGQPNLNLARALDAIVAGGVIIMNSDERNFAGLRLSKPVRLITYGYNPKSTVTASSIIVHDNISIQYCIQRQFSTLAGIILEPQEFLIRTNHMNLAAEDILAAVSIAMLCGASADKISGVNQTNQALSYV
ncbi:MAG: hypothetical protein FWE24_03715 [Defluviitaleaceae bacterium]|nr:hypothetical protein [Defluviitaleaceae bacterium]